MNTDWSIHQTLIQVSSRPSYEQAARLLWPEGSVDVVQLLVELAQERDAQIPALVYEARSSVRPHPPPPPHLPHPLPWV